MCYPNSPEQPFKFCLAVHVRTVDRSWLPKVQDKFDHLLGSNSLRLGTVSPKEFSGFTVSGQGFHHMMGWFLDLSMTYWVNLLRNLGYSRLKIDLRTAAGAHPP